MENKDNSLRFGKGLGATPGFSKEALVLVMLQMYLRVNVGTKLRYASIAYLIHF